MNRLGAKERGLVIGRGTDIAVFHASIMRQTCETCKPLVLQGSRRISKPTLCEHGRDQLPNR